MSKSTCDTDEEECQTGLRKEGDKEDIEKKCNNIS
jgi:hypothetical protein